MKTEMKNRWLNMFKSLFAAAGKEQKDSFGGEPILSATERVDRELTNAGYPPGSDAPLGYEQSLWDKERPYS